MKIKETYTTHTGLVDVGRFAFFINLSKDGIYIPNKELVEQAMHFPRVVLLGEPFEQKDDIVKLCKKLKKEKPSIEIEINTNGTIRPIGIANIDIIYNIHLQLKVSNIEYKNRVRPNIVNWFNEIGANFIFSINSEDEMDETNLIVQENNIKKRDVYLTFLDNERVHKVRKWAKKYSYNFAPDFKEFLWPKDGRE